MASEIVRFAISDPLEDLLAEHGLPSGGQQLPEQATREEAELRAAAIRAGCERFVRDVVPQMLQAYLCRDWAALDYPSWEAYVRDRWGTDRLRLPAQQRQAIAQLFRLRGVSTRAIASAVNVDQRTVRRDLADSGAANAAPAEVLGTDGKQYQPKTDVVEGKVVEPEPDYCRRCGHRCAHEVPCELVDGPEGPQCADAEACAERLAGDVAEQRARAEEAAGAPAEPVVPEREVEWPPVAVPGGAVESATPAGPTAEAPADEAPEVVYRAWRGNAANALRNARRELGLVTGDFADPGTVAERADDAALEELERLGAELTEFCRQVREMRAPAVVTVWMSTTRRGLDYHKPGATAIEARMNVGSTVCGRSLRTGVRLELQEAVDRYDAKPCSRCWPDEGSR
jgi:hypothetical protein